MFYTGSLSDVFVKRLAGDNDGLDRVRVVVITVVLLAVGDDVCADGVGKSVDFDGSLNETVGAPVSMSPANFTSKDVGENDNDGDIEGVSGQSKEPGANLPFRVHISLRIQSYAAETRAYTPGYPS